MPLRELLDRFDDSLPLERARTIPAAWYFDGELAELERRRVFGAGRLWVGRSAQVDAPGKFFTFDLAGEPIVVTRDGPELRAFHNVCRHRGARVANEDEGTCSRLRCRYHGWTYDLGGHLIGVPEFTGVEEFPREANGLPPIRVESDGAFVWLVFGDDDRSLSQWTAPLDRYGMLDALRGLRFHSRREYRLACNWKVFVDNYLDGGYHVNTVHPALAGVLDYAKYRTEIDGHASIQISPLDKSGDVAAVRAGENAYYAWVWPNLMVNLYEGVADTNLVLPDGPGACRVVFDFYFAPAMFETDEGRSAMARSVEVAEQVQAEDVGICEEVQRGLRSTSYDVGRFSVKRENGGYHFHRLLARRLREPDA